MALLTTDQGPKQLRSRLLETCLVRIEHGETPITASQCPERIQQLVSEAMAVADPLGEIQLDVSCPSCEKSWDVVFDIGSFLWKEIDSWARRLLRDVHCLASTYGWSEETVLKMSSLRRDWYLDLVKA